MSYHHSRRQPPPTTKTGAAWRHTTPRANTTARGYGATHQRLRNAWNIRVQQGGVDCWRCNQPIKPGTPWHLGHDDHDRRVYRGPEHDTCNTRAAATKAVAQQREPKPRMVSRW